MNSQRKQQARGGNGIKTDKYGRPLNFGNYKNGRLVTNKSKGGKSGGGGGRGGGGKGGRGGGGGDRGGNNAGRGATNSRASALLSSDNKGGGGGGGGGKKGNSSSNNNATINRSEFEKLERTTKKQDVAGHVGLTRDAHAIIHEALQNHTVVYDSDSDESTADDGNANKNRQQRRKRNVGSSPDLQPPLPLKPPSGAKGGGKQRNGPNGKGGGGKNTNNDGGTTDIYMGPMADQRKTLPVFSYRQQLLETISANRATVVEGETGSGKTTQVPQYVLEDAAQQGAPCNIVVAQPRRVSAMSVAERVASERGESIGGTVGYSIRLERKATSNTRLLFCTTGILLKRLEDDATLTNVTHVFVDEVHERSLEGDFLLMVLRDLIPEREKLAKESAGRIPPLKIVLMSATLDASLFHDYFWGAPSVKFPGRTFPVTELYLEDAMEVTGHVVRGNEDWARKGGKNGGGGNAAKPGDGKSGKGRVPLKDDPRLAPLPDRDDEYLNGRELAERYANYSPSVQNGLAKIDHNAINYTLVVETIAWLSKLPSPQSAAEFLDGKKKSRGGSKPQGDATGSGAGDSTDTTSSAILVFLPGIKEITTLQELLQQSPAFRNGQARDWVLPIHSTIPPEEQRLVFTRPPKGVRKVVLATNIAETAITIDDVAFVVDTGRMKENRYDPVKRMSSLEDCLVARSNARQRRGRAGRVRTGTAVHLFTRHRHDKIAAVAQDPEVMRVPLEQLVLRIKALKYPGTAADVCARLLEPPSDAAVQKAIDELKFLEAMTVDSNGVETMTPLGVHLSHLPVDCRIGKLILLGAMFGVTNDALTVAATLSYRSPFQSPISKREEADRAKMSFATAQSDHLSVVRAYNEVDSIKGHAKYDFCRENFLSIKTLQTIGGLKRQFLELLSAAGFVRPGLRSRGVEGLGRRNGGNDGVALALEQGLGDRRFGGRGGDGGAKGGRTTQKAMPGDWECDVQACQARNFARNQRCFRCRADKPEKPYVYPEEEEKKEEDFLEDNGSDDDDDDDSDSDDEEENTQPILKALLVAGLFPQMVMLETKEGKKGKGKSQPTLRGKPEHNGEKPEDMALHPSSIAGKCLSSMSSKYLVYHERVKTTRVYIRDATPVSPYALLLFGGGSIRVEPCAAGSLESVMRLDGWLGFKCPRRDHMLVTELRGVLDGIMRNKIENPKSEFCANARGIIGAVKCILEMDEEGTAVQDRERHLTALDRLVKKSKGKGKGGGGGGGGGKKKKAKGRGSGSRGSGSRGSGSRGSGDNRGKKQSAAGRIPKQHTMFALRRIAAPSIRAMSTYRRTAPLSKGFNIHWQELHIKDKVITFEKSLAVLAVGTLAIMLPSPPSCIEGVTEIDCANNFEEPFDSH